MFSNSLSKKKSAVLHQSPHEYYQHAMLKSFLFFPTQARGNITVSLKDASQQFIVQIQYIRAADNKGREGVVNFPTTIQPHSARGQKAPASPSGRASTWKIHLSETVHVLPQIEKLDQRDIVRMQDKKTDVFCPKTNKDANIQHSFLQGT